MVINLNDQLVLGSFEWTINYSIKKMDISLFEQNYSNDEKRAADYLPRVLLKTIMYCYSRGILSSRRIERAYKNNIVVKALALVEGCESDHDKIALFISLNSEIESIISINSEAITDLYSQVLLKCSELKLITREMFAIDGCKLSSNASKECSGKLSDLVI